jgi:hypothetical protein
MFQKFWKNTPAEKRSNERIPIHLNVGVVNSDSLHNGLVTNFSENGIYFLSGANLSSGLDIQVVIPLKEDHLNVPVKIIRRAKTGYLYDGFGAELLNSSQDYIEFVHNHNSQL